MYLLTFNSQGLDKSSIYCHIYVNVFSVKKKKKKKSLQMSIFSFENFSNSEQQNNRYCSAVIEISHCCIKHLISLISFLNSYSKHICWLFCWLESCVRSTHIENKKNTILTPKLGDLLLMIKFLTRKLVFAAEFSLLQIQITIISVLKYLGSQVD